MPPPSTRSTPHDAASLLAFVVVLSTYARTSRRVQDPLLRASYFRSAVWCASLSLWPLLWNRLASGCRPPILVGLAWPYAVMAMDVLGSGLRPPTSEREGSQLSSSSSPSSVQIEPHHVLSMCFACSGIVSAANNRRHMSVFLIPIVVILVVSTAEPKGPYRDEYDAMRTVVTALCGGMLITGVMYQECPLSSSRVPEADCPLLDRRRARKT